MKKQNVSSVEVNPHVKISEGQKVNNAENTQESKSNSFFRENFDCTFRLNEQPAKKDVDSISNFDMTKYEINPVLRSQILKRNNYYKLVNYNSSCFDSSMRQFEVRVLFGNYDYYNHLLLMTSVNDSLIDIAILASETGDDEEFERITSILKANGTIYRTTEDAKLSDGRYNIENTELDSIKIKKDGKIEIMQ